MQTHLETRNREAFELVTDALEAVDRYRVSRDISVLDDAKEKLVAAIQKDPAYFRASYYSAIVDDLAGRSAKAAEELQKLVPLQPTLADEVRYNLAVAEYHGYRHEALDRAIEHFSEVLRESGEPALQLLAQAGLAQANAMHMIPKLPEEPDLASIQGHFECAMKMASNALNGLQKYRPRWHKAGKRQLPVSTANDVEWTAHNARGMALMYFSDYFPPATESAYKEKRVATLSNALRELEKADAVAPKNWANYCDMASADMRLGVYTQEFLHFVGALARLQQVVDRLRPGYAFALYEMGRIHRIAGEFDQAIGLFKRVLSIPLDQRDISDRRPKLELARAERHDKTFP